MKRSAFILFAVIFAGAGSVAHAQATSQTRTTTAKSAAIDPRDSVTIADVQRAADELARTVQEVVKKVTESPELKVAALNLAKESVNAAQVIVAQQAETLQSVLESLAKQVSAATVTIQQSKPKTH
jgi:isopentenyl phosphate kinase